MRHRAMCGSRIARSRPLWFSLPPTHWALAVAGSRSGKGLILQKKQPRSMCRRCLAFPRTLKSYRSSASDIPQKRKNLFPLTNWITERYDTTNIEKRPQKACCGITWLEQRGRGEAPIPHYGDGGGGASPASGYTSRRTLRETSSIMFLTFSLYATIWGVAR